MHTITALKSSINRELATSHTRLCRRGNLLAAPHDNRAQFAGLARIRRHRVLVYIHGVVKFVRLIGCGRAVHGYVLVLERYRYLQLRSWQERRHAPQERRCARPPSAAAFYRTPATCCLDRRVYRVALCTPRYQSTAASSCQTTHTPVVQGGRC